tara:strand:+ start:28 stop:345 length:318 start_codon:yes stop_codon:yes gene_type:complete
MFLNYKKIKQAINGKRYTLFIANTNLKKRKGLSGIKNIPRNCGMLFPYNKEEPDRSFTMKNVYFPLHIIFLDKNMNIVHQEKASPNQRNLVICKNPSMYVVEIPA